MERSSKRGKIPQSDWPSIMARYEAGETLSSIARTYDCSPPAISYVVSRSRARQPGHAQPPREAPRPPAVGEPQLIKASAVASTGPSVNGGGDHAAHREAAPPPPADVPPAQTSPYPEHGSDPRPAHGAGNGFERTSWATREPNAADLFAPNRASAAPRASEPSLQHTAPPQHAAPQAKTNGDPRARLHLHLGDALHANGGAAASDPPHADQPQARAPQRQPQGSNGGGYRPAWANAGLQHQSAAPEPQHQRPTSPNHQPVPQHTNGGHPGNGGRAESHGEPRKENGAFIDRELRARVEADITAFLAAFDAALAEDTLGSRVGLREATDRLLRAGARTRIELERLEARMPLPPRDGARPAEPAWRQR